MKAMKGEKMEANENREVKDYTGVSVPTQGAGDTGCGRILGVTEREGRGYCNRAAESCGIPQ